MSVQTVPDLSDADVLESNLGLYLKPITRIKINVQLPKLCLPGQSISSWHVMEKLRATVKPDTFLNLKALKITSTVIKFEGELETKAACERALARLRSASSLKISGFTEKLLVRAAHSSASGPTRHDWEAFFRDAKGVNEMKPGERPDTIHLQELPVRWFCEGSKNGHPNEKLLKLAFGTFGKVRRLEIPSKVESSVNTIGKTNSLHKDLLFEVYVQYEEYVEFAIAMDSLRGKKLLYKESNGKVYSADIKVDFDRTRYLSEACIKKREAEEKKLNSEISAAKEKETPKDHHSYPTSQAKPESQAPVQQTLPTQPASDSQTRLVKDSDSIAKEKDGNIILEDKKKAQLEAELLLRELLHRAEVTERQKELAKPLDVEHNQLKIQKKPNESSSPNKASDKKVKVVKEKLYKELEMNRNKHPPEKRALSEERKSTESATKDSKKQHHDKRIKIDIENKDNFKEKRMSPEKRIKETVSRSHEDKHKERTSICNSKLKERETKLPSSKCYKDASNHEKKLKEKDYLTRYERTTKDYHHNKKHRDKETLMSCNKKTDYKSTPKEKDTPIYYERTIENCDTVQRKKKHRDRESVRYCDEPNKDSSSSKSEKKSTDSQMLVDEKVLKTSKGEIEVEKKTMLDQKEEERRMYMEEQKIKERLIQVYNQKKRNQAKLLEQERILKEKLLRNMKEREREKLKEREKLRKELSGRNVLKSVLGGTNSPSSFYKKR